MFINGFDILWDEIDDYVADIKSIRSIDSFMFTKPVTFFCGENGSGKSTLLEALAIKNGLNPERMIRILVCMNICVCGVLENRIGCISCVQKASIMSRQKKWNMWMINIHPKDIIKNRMDRVSVHF